RAQGAAGPGGFVGRGGAAGRGRRPPYGVGDRRVSRARVRPHLLAVHAAARAASADRRQGREDPRPPPARGGRAGDTGKLIASSATVLSGEIAVPCTGNPL